MLDLTPEKQQFLLDRGIPQKYLIVTDEHSYTTSFNKLVQVLQEKSLFVYGGVGVGKTQLICDLLSDLSNLKTTTKEVGEWNEESEYIFVPKQVFDSKLFKYYSMPRLLIEIRGLYGSSRDLDDFLNDLASYEYLVLDDIGVEKPTDWVMETVYVILNERYEQGKKVVFTSNKNVEELAVSLGDRIASRIVEMCEIVKLNGTDRRLNARK